MLLEDHLLGHYRLVRQIGSGGMGTIFLAEDTHMPRQVAVKVIRTGGDDMPHTQEAAQRILRSFQREMRAIVQLDHPHILPVFDFGQETIGEATYSYLVMLYRPEGSLSDWLHQLHHTKQISLANAAEWFTQAAQALQHAHARGIVHQDVKMSNFLVRTDTAHPEDLPDLLLADFGIARFSSTTTTHSQSHSVRGTPMFMSPEQWDGKPVPASDQYALAIMAFRLLTGRFPFHGTLGQIMHHHYMAQPPAPSSLNPQLNASIDQVILHALAKEPGQRFPDIMAFANAFSQAIHSSGSLQRVPITSNALDELPSPSRSIQNLTVSIIAEEGKLTANPPFFKGNDDPTFIKTPQPTSPNNAPTPASLTLTRMASTPANDDPALITPTRATSSIDVVGLAAVPPIISPTITPREPVIQVIPTTPPNQQQADVISRKYSPLQKSLALVLLALIILAGSGILLYQGFGARKSNASSPQLRITTRTVHTPAGNITIITVTAAASTTGQNTTNTGGSVPGSTPTSSTGPQATATATSGSGSHPTPTTVPPTPTTVPPPPPPPPPPPGCTISPWSLTLHSESSGGTVLTVTPYCNHTVYLRFTQAPTYTTDLQVCFGPTDCSGWNSAPSTQVGTFIEFFSQVSGGFTVNARCHGGGTCPSIYTVYGQAKY